MTAPLRSPARRLALRVSMLLAAAGFGALDPSRVAAQNWQPLAEIETLGAGTSGAAGVPELRVLGWAALDQPGAGLRLRHGAPGALAQIVLSLTEGPTRLPGYGGQLWPGAPFIRWATALDAQGDSPVLHSGPAPTPPALAGQDIFVQGLVLDGAARGGAALTSGVRIRVGAGSTAARLFSESRPAFDPPGTHPSELAVGDVDGDGRPDLVFPVNTPPRRVGVMRQLADGSLAPQLSSPVTPSVTDLELADLDGDGALDVVEAAGPLLILHGLGNGTFGPATVLPSPTGTVTIVAVGDVTGDGRPDLVAPGWTFHTLGVLPGLEGGGFGEAIILPVNDVELAQGVQLADIDGDGLLDVLIATKQPSLGAGTFLVVLRALGGGAFAAPVSTSVGDKSKPQLAVGDIDGDGTPDALIGSGGKFVLSFHVLLNDGSGAYPSAVLSTIVYPNWISHADLDDISIADMDGDGAGEVILISGLTGMAGSMRHIGGGALEAPMWLGLRAYELAPADMDGDGHADLAFLQEGLAGAAGTDWVAGVGDGTLALLPTVPGFVTSSAATADLDGDGDLDLFGRVLSDHSLEVVLGDGQGGFGPPNVISPGEGGAAYDSVAVGDLDGDGITDLVARVAAGTALWRGHGDGTFATPALYGGMSRMQIADVTRDGLADVIGIESTTVKPGRLVVMPGQTDGTLGAPTFTPGAAGTTLERVTLGDIDGDGALDAIVNGSMLSIFRGTGTAAFQAGVLVPSSFNAGTGDYGLGVAAADLDHDGDADIAQCTHEGVQVWTNDGAGSFAKGASCYYSSWPDLTIADVNDDGAPDIIGCGVWLGFGDGSFAPFEFDGALGIPGDFDGDGDLDFFGWGPLYFNALY